MYYVFYSFRGSRELIRIGIGLGQSMFGGDHTPTVGLQVTVLLLARASYDFVSLLDRRASYIPCLYVYCCFALGIGMNYKYLDDSGRGRGDGLFGIFIANDHIRRDNNDSNNGTNVINS